MLKLVVSRDDSIYECFFDIAKAPLKKPAFIRIQVE